MYGAVPSAFRLYRWRAFLAAGTVALSGCFDGNELRRYVPLVSEEAVLAYSHRAIAMCAAAIFSVPPSLQEEFVQGGSGGAQAWADAHSLRPWRETPIRAEVDEMSIIYTTLSAYTQECAPDTKEPASAASVARYEATAGSFFTNAGSLVIIYDPELDLVLVADS